MLETTPEYHNLSYALATAQKILNDLPKHSISGDLDELKLKAYVLLRHAALEEYLEKVSVYALNTAMRSFEVSGVVAEPLVSVCAYYNISAVPYLTETGGNLRFSDIFAKTCRVAIQKHVAALGGVHGIKTKDQDAILEPIGLKLHAFDHVLSQKLDSIGENRGGVAHRFGIRHVHPRQALERDTVYLLRLLEPFDNEICRKIVSLFRL